MQLVGMKPNSTTLDTIFPVCANKGALEQGIGIHQNIIGNKYLSNVVVISTLVDMYGNCGSPTEARHVFDKMLVRDLVSWNAMIEGYAQNGHCEEVLRLFEKMQAMVFAPDLVTWNVVIVGHTQNNNPHEALKLLRKMIVADFKPDSVTATSILPTCAQLATLQFGKEIHGYAICYGFQSNAIVQNALIDVYTKCGSSNNAYHMFHTVAEKSVVSWNMMVAGYSYSGYYEESLHFFQQMQLVGMKPNNVTLASVLPVITHLSNLQQGKEIHVFVLRNGFESFIIVMNGLLDMYNKCGNMEQAHKLYPWK